MDPYLTIAGYFTFQGSASTSVLVGAFVVSMQHITDNITKVENPITSCKLA